MYTYETKKKRGKIVDLSRCSMKKIRELIVFTAFLVVALWKFDVVIEVLKSIWKIVFPFALGGAIAFVINVPMSFLEKKMLGKIKENNKIGKKAARPIEPQPVKRTEKKYKVFPASSQALLAAFMRRGKACAFPSASGRPDCAGHVSCCNSEYTAGSSGRARACW